VDNILRVGQVLKFENFFCRVDKITDFYSTIYYPVTGGKKFLGENFKESFHTSISLSKILFRKLC